MELLLLLAAALAVAVVYLLRIAPIGAAYKAKAVCSALFVSGRELAAVLAEDVAVESYRIMRIFSVRVNWHNQSVNGSWLASRRFTLISLVRGVWCVNVNPVGPPCRPVVGRFHDGFGDTAPRNVRIAGRPFDRNDQPCRETSDRG